MGCCSTKVKKLDLITPEQQALAQLQQWKNKLPEIKSFDVTPLYRNERPENEMYKKLAERFNRSYDFSPSKANKLQKTERAILPGPKSYKVP